MSEPPEAVPLRLLRWARTVLAWAWPALAGAALSALALAAWGWRGHGDPLRATLALVPLVVGLSATAHRSAAGARQRRTAAALEAIALVALVVLGLDHAVLGVPGIENGVATGLLLLLGLHLRRRLLELRPVVARCHRTPLAFFLLPLAAYLAILPWSTLHRPPDGDEPWYLLIAHSLAFDHDTDLANNYQNDDARRFLDRSIEPQPNDPQGQHGERYSRHSAFLPALIAPFYALGGRLGALAAMALMSALLAWATLAAGRRELPSSPSGTLLSYALLAFLPPLLLYSGQVWVEVPAGLLLLAALALVRRIDALGREDPPGSILAPAALLVLVLVALPLVKLRFAVFSVSIMALALLRLRRWRKHLAIVCAIGAACIGVDLFSNWLVFGHPLRIHVWSELWLFRVPLRSYVVSSSGLLFDVAFGLFFCAPLWVLLLLVPLRVHAVRRLAIDTAILAVPYLVLVSSRVEWYGGWSPPFRYPLPLLPLFALLLVPLWQERRRAHAAALLAPLWASTLLLAVVWVVYPGLTYNFADGRTRLLDLATSRLGAGLAAFLPSSTRPRAATWLFPLVAVVFLYALWLAPRHLPRRWRRWGSRTTASMLGAAACALVLLGWGWVAKTRVTHRIEVESPYVRKSAPQRTFMDPPEWTYDRRRFREAWVLPEGERLEAPVHPGGPLVTIVVEGRLIQNDHRTVELELRDDTKLLGKLHFDAPGEWMDKQLGPLEWQAGAPLIVAVPPARRDGRPQRINGVAIDAIEMLWSKAPQP